MNAYLVHEEGEARVYAANDMAGAVLAAWFDVLRDTVQQLGRHPTEEEAQAERAKWEKDSLQSVALVGEIENFAAVALAARPST